MPDADDIAEAIATNATGPRSSSKDGESLQTHSIADQIAAAKFAANQEAAAADGLGIRIAQFKPIYE